MKFAVKGDKFIEDIEAENMNEAWEKIKEKRNLKGYTIASRGKAFKNFTIYQKDGKGKDRIQFIKISEI